MEGQRTTVKRRSGQFVKRSGVEMDTNFQSTLYIAEIPPDRGNSKALREALRRNSMSRNIVTLAGAATAVALVIECVRRFRRQRSVHTVVLDYWFAGDLETAYETKWFVQAGSAATCPRT